MTNVTYADALGAYRITIPPHLEAQAEVPVVSGLWRQGDIYMRPEPDLAPKGAGVAAVGVKVVQGDADRNSHILDCPGGRWHPGTYKDATADYGVVFVPAGAVAYVTHTGEHGSVGLAGGDTGTTWRLWSQLSYEQELRRAAD